MKFLKVLIVITFFLVPAKARSGDTLRIVTYPKQVHFYVKITPIYSNVEIRNPHIDKELLFKPNVESAIKLGFYYSWFGLAYRFLLPSNEASNKKYGNTQKRDFEIHCMTPRLIVDLSYKNYKGYYLSNPEDFFKNWNRAEDKYPHAPDLNTKSLGASFAYVFSPGKYSPRAAYSYTASMLRSGGSWMLGGFVSRSGIYSDTSIVPLSIKQYVDPKFNLKSVVFTDLGISFGYSYLHTLFKKGFVSVTVLPGLAYQKNIQQFSVDGSKMRDNALSIRSVLHFSMGRNGEKYYWGLETYRESSRVRSYGSGLSLTSGYFGLFAGIRLPQSDGKFMKGVDKVLHPHFAGF